MKLWLFDVLACPIDKHFPLKLLIFSYKTSKEEFSEILQKYLNKRIEDSDLEDIIEIKSKNGILYIKDLICIKKQTLKDYIKCLLDSINELKNIHDKTNLNESKQALTLITNEVKQSLLDYIEFKEKKEFSQLYPQLYLLNKIKCQIEIDSGLIYCEKCNRWYPIIETIPQMLPDEYRNEHTEIEFLNKYKNLLEPEVTSKNLKPFHP